MNLPTIRVNWVTRSNIFYYDDKYFFFGKKWERKIKLTPGRVWTLGEIKGIKIYFVFITESGRHENKYYKLITFVLIFFKN